MNQAISVSTRTVREIESRKDGRLVKRQEATQTDTEVYRQTVSQKATLTGRQVCVHCTHMFND